MIFMGVLVQILLVVLVSVLLITDGRWEKSNESDMILKWDKRLVKTACVGFCIGAFVGACSCVTILGWSLEVRRRSTLFSIILNSFLVPIVKSSIIFPALLKL